MNTSRGVSAVARLPRLPNHGLPTPWRRITRRPSHRSSQLASSKRPDTISQEVVRVDSPPSTLATGLTSRDAAEDIIGQEAAEIGLIGLIPEAPLQAVALEETLQSLEVLASSEKSYKALIGWAAAATAFGCGIWYIEGAGKAQEYFAGYLLEQSLSVDNLFVFVLVFGYFKTPPKLQNKVLTYGILSAGILRAVMVLLGIELITSFRPVLAVFAGILVFSSFKLLTAGGGESAAEGNLSSNALVRWCKTYIRASDEYDGDKFFTLAADGSRIATPLLLVLAVVELSDVVFAVDSIPAVFGVTLDPFIVYSSNIFAILSLRSLYSFVATIMRELHYLDKAVAVVLGFVGVKMLVSFVDVEIPTDVSLLVVGALLGTGVAASLLLPEGRSAPPA